jgi:hypothetical protein
MLTRGEHDLGGVLAIGLAGRRRRLRAVVPRMRPRSGEEVEALGPGPNWFLVVHMNRNLKWDNGF